MASSPDEKRRTHTRKIREALDRFESAGAVELRTQVRELAAVYEDLSELGRTLVPEWTGLSARWRLLEYFRRYPGEVISGGELRVVAGIQEWARRVRELRVEHGWPIASGVSIREMMEEEEGRSALGDLRPDDYVLLGSDPDQEAAERWRTITDLRRSDLSGKDAILAFLQRNVGTPVTGEELRSVAKDSTEWARRVRELRTEEGWPVATRFSGRPDLPVGIYLLEGERKNPDQQRVPRAISDSVRRDVLERDDYTCRACGWRREMWTREDPRFFELHHLEEHQHGGENTPANLVTLCNRCHDDVHAGRLESPEAGG